MQTETCDEKLVAEFADEVRKRKCDEDEDDDEYNQPFELDQ